MEQTETIFGDGNANKLEILNSKKNTIKMKHILYILFMVCVLNAKAQNHELKKIYNQIDKIIESEQKYYHKQIQNNAKRINKLKWYSSIYEPLYAYGKIVRQPLNRKYEKQVLKYLKKYRFDKMRNVRETVYELIYSVGFYSKNLKIRQKALNYLLDMVFAVFETRGYNIEDFKVEDFDKKAKKRLKEIINGKRTKKDIIFYIENDMRLTKYSKGSRMLAQYISKEDSLPFEHVMDSLLIEQLNYAKNKFKTASGYGDRYILLTGRLYMYDFIPELEEMLKNKKYKNEKENIKYALARMGNKKYEQEFLKKRNVWGEKYINTQNSAWNIIKELYENPPDENCDPNYKEYEIELSDVLVPKKYFIIDFVQNWILNFPEEYKLPKHIDICIKRHDFQAGKYEEQAEKAKQWLLENKGKYKLNPKSW